MQSSHRHLWELESDFLLTGGGETESGEGGNCSVGAMGAFSNWRVSRESIYCAISWRSRLYMWLCISRTFSPPSSWQFNYSWRGNFSLCGTHHTRLLILTPQGNRMGPCINCVFSMRTFFAIPHAKSIFTNTLATSPQKPSRPSLS